MAVTGRHAAPLARRAVRRFRDLRFACRHLQLRPGASALGRDGGLRVRARRSRPCSAGASAASTWPLACRSAAPCCCRSAGWRPRRSSSPRSRSWPGPRVIADPPGHSLRERRVLAGTQNPNAYNPYLPVMTLFGLPRAVIGGGALTDPRVWFGVVFLLVFWLALRDGGARHPGRWAILIAASPVIAFELAVGGTDVPMVAFLCLGFALLCGAPGPAVPSRARRSRARRRRRDEGDRVARGGWWRSRCSRSATASGRSARSRSPRWPWCVVCVGPFVVAPQGRSWRTRSSSRSGWPASPRRRRARCPAMSSRTPGTSGTRSSSRRWCWPGSQSPHRWSSGRRGRCRGRSRCSPRR